MPWSSNATFLVDVCHDGDDGARRSTSPAAASARCGTSRAGLYRREVAASTCREALGWGLVPPTILRDGPARRGLAAVVRRRRPLRAALLHDPRAAPGSPRPAARRSRVFDLLANNTDRKSGHCLLGDDGRVWAIDHGLCFAADFKLRTVIWEFAGEPVDADLVADVGRIAAEVPAVLTEFLHDDEIDALRNARRECSTIQPFPATHLAIAIRGHSCDRREELERLVDRGDLDALLRLVEHGAAAGDWDGLVALRTACRTARHSGRQLWPAATLAEYRLALEGPGPVCGVDVGRRRRSLRRGPTRRSSRHPAHVDRSRRASRRWSRARCSAMNVSYAAKS